MQGILWISDSQQADMSPEGGGRGYRGEKKRTLEGDQSSREECDLLGRSRCQESYHLRWEVVADSRMEGRRRHSSEDEMSFLS